MLCVVLFRLLHLFAYIFRSFNNKSRACDLGRFDKTSTYVCVRAHNMITFLIVHYYNVAFRVVYISVSQVISCVTKVKYYKYKVYEPLIKLKPSKTETI